MAQSWPWDSQIAVKEKKPFDTKQSDTVKNFV